MSVRSVIKGVKGRLKRVRIEFFLLSNQQRQLLPVVLEALVAPPRLRVDVVPRLAHPIRLQRARRHFFRLPRRSAGVSICTFVPVKQAERLQALHFFRLPRNSAGVSICTCVPVKHVLLQTGTQHLRGQYLHFCTK